MSRPQWSSRQWEGPVRVAFGYAHAGWVQLALLTPAFGQSAVIDCSDVPPSVFQGLLTWLYALVDARLPATLTIDEEFRYTSLCARRTEHGEDAIEFTVTHHHDPHPNLDAVPQLRCRTWRLGLAGEFARRLQQWLAEDYDPTQFGGESFPAPDDPPGRDDLRRLDLGPLLTRLAGGRGDGSEPAP